MTDAQRNGRWLTMASSALGGTHRQRALPNQDAVSLEDTDYGFIVAIADGHGGARYVRSEIGSRVAVATAVETVRRLLGDGEPVEATLRRAVEEIVTAWRRRIDAHRREHPFTTDEQTRAGGSLDESGYEPYGATLLLVAARGDDVAAAQLGDGDVMMAGDDGSVDRPIPSDARNVGNVTTSLCLSDASTSFRFANLSRGGRAPALVLLATDGYGNSFTNSEWPPVVARDLFAELRQTGPDAVRASLPQWVDDSARAGGDDVTVAVALRADVAAGRTRLITPVGDHNTAAARAGPREPPRRRGLWLSIGAVIVALFVGVGIGWAWRGADPDGGSPTSTEPALTTVSTTIAAASTLRPPIISIGPPTTAPTTTSGVTTTTTTAATTTTVATTDTTEPPATGPPERGPDG